MASMSMLASCSNVDYHCRPLASLDVWVTKLIISATDVSTTDLNRNPNIDPINPNTTLTLTQVTLILTLP